MTGSSDGSIAPKTSAIHDFHNARQKAALENLLANLTGKSADLLRYDEVRKGLHAIESPRRQLQQIPLDSIVGSVNRYTDFSRTFLPRNPSDQERWARVRLAVESMEGLPPIEVYQVGDAYFVLDGHHRVSVARELGSDTIQAYVTTVQTRVPLSPGDRPDDLILKAEYTDFLDQTRLDELRPGSNLLLTAPGQYPKLNEHIATHRYFMGLEQHKEITWQEAVTHWYDTVYEPITALIHERGLLRDFPGRTEADLYLWIMEHRLELGGGQFGWEVSPAAAAKDLSARYSPTPQRRLPRLLYFIQKHLIPTSLEPSPPTGQWRREHNAVGIPHRSDHLFDDLLVSVVGPLPGKTATWSVVDFAIEIARREEARLTGLHIVRAEIERGSAEVETLREEFTRRSVAAGVASRLVVEIGSAAERLCSRSPWADLVLFRLNHPPPLQPIVRLRSGARFLIRQCSAPLLSVPARLAIKPGSFVQNVLLAYGSGRNANEALFVSAYLAAHWGVSVTVITVQSKNKFNAPNTDYAREYLESQGVNASYIEERGNPARQVLLASEAQQCDLILMGGYESGPITESLRASTVDRVLASTRKPVLICR